MVDGGLVYLRLTLTCLLKCLHRFLTVKAHMGSLFKDNALLVCIDVKIAEHCVPAWGSARSGAASQRKQPTTNKHNYYS